MAWHKESRRHSLASKGIRTGIKAKPISRDAQNLIRPEWNKMQEFLEEKPKKAPKKSMGSVKDIRGYEKLEPYNQELLQRIRKKRPIIYTDIESVSRSGMMRKINVFMVENNQKINLNHLVSEVSGYTRDKKTGALRVGGAGMDMGFSVVYNFSHSVFPKGFNIRKGDHNRNAFSGAKPTDPNYNYDSDGGYALKQQWW